MRRLSSRSRILCALLAHWGLVAACGNEQGAPGTQLDLSGSWRLREETTACGLSSPIEFDVKIVQDRGSLTVVAGGDTLVGTILGDRIDVSGTLGTCERGPRAIDSLDLTVTSTGDSLAGTADWCCPDPPILCGCSGTSVVGGARVGP